MKHRRLAMAGALLLLALTVIPIPFARALNQAAPLSQTGQNLLVNPGFEGLDRPENNSTPNWGNHTRDTFTGAQYAEIFTPQGWVTWWQEGDFKRPECHVIPKEYPFLSPMRIREGYYSVKCFSFYGKMNAGVFQVVRNLAPGAVVEGSFNAHAWACNESSEAALSCGDAHAFYFRVGIDPTGGTDPFSGNIVWSAPYYHYDQFGKVGPVQATVGANGAATLFLQGYAKWPYQHNDAYFDSASLVQVTQGEPPAPTAAPPPPTSSAPQPTSAPAPTALPRPDGATVHIVQEGDSLFGIACQYMSCDLERLRALNGLGPNDNMLSIGQEIVISGATVVIPTATPSPEPTQDISPEQPTEQPTEIPTVIIPVTTGDTGSLCVLAFNDQNNDMIRQEGESLLPSSSLSLIGVDGVVGTPYTTDGLNEPYCFENLPPGNYVLRQTPPPGYAPSGPNEWGVMVAAGSVSSLQLGYTREDGSTTPVATPEGEPETQNPDGNDTPSGGANKILTTIIRITGGIVLLLALAVVGLIIVSRRRV